MSISVHPKLPIPLYGPAQLGSLWRFQACVHETDNVYHYIGNTTVTVVQLVEMVTNHILTTRFLLLTL